MSDIKWCDTGGHAFSANDPDAESYASTTVDHNDKRRRIDICGPCVSAGMSFRDFQPPQRQALVNQMTVPQDAETVSGT